MKKRIYFILSDENLFHPMYLLGLIQSFDEKQYVVAGITLALDTHRKGIRHFVLQQLELWGFLGFFFIAMNTIIIAMLDRFRSNNHISLRNIARIYSLKLIETYDVNSNNHLLYLTKLRPDIIISSQGHIFRKDLLRLPKIACINRHTALLPKYGGVLPVFWTMYHNEEEFGVSIHYMVEKIDAGDILFQVKIPLNKKNSLFKNYMYAFDKSIDATLGALKNLKRHKVMYHYRSSERGYFSFPSNDKMREFKKSYKAFSLGEIAYYYNIFRKKYSLHD